MFTIFPDGAKAVVDFSWNNTPASFVLHFEFSSPVAQDYIDLAEAVAGEFATNVMPNLSVDLVMGEITVYDLSEEFAPKYVNADEVSTAGGDVLDSVPNNTAALISHRTTATGRSGRGRTYVPGINETDESEGLLNVAQQAILAVDWADFITAVELTGWVFVIAQRYLAGQQLSTGVMRAVVTEILKRQLGTQRRRQVQSAT